MQLCTAHERIIICIQYLAAEKKNKIHISFVILMEHFFLQSIRERIFTMCITEATFPINYFVTEFLSTSDIKVKGFLFLH